jgi:CYTH domain-containing protein
VQKKFRLHAVPEAHAPDTSVAIVQGYIVCGGAELRIRRLGAAHSITVKTGDAPNRTIWSADLPEWTFDALWPAVGDRVVEKTRGAIACGALSGELEIYSGRLAGLVILECECPPGAEMRDDAGLPARAIDVTNDRRYANSHLARFGIPPLDLQAKAMDT